MRHAGYLVVMGWLAACTGGPSEPDGGTTSGPDTAGADAPPPRPAVQWAEADELFHREPRWLGGDAAYSVDLGDGRVLWLFGDSFIATSEALTRRESRLVRNSVAIQTGLCPLTAEMSFHWRQDEEMPTSWLPEDGEHWRWPLHGVVVDGALTLFWLREQRVEGPLPFETVGWEAFRIADFSGDPTGWTLEPLEGFETPFPAGVGTAVIAEGDFVYAYVVEEPGTHSVYLARWARSAFAAGEITAPEWWDEGGWTAHASLTDRPLALFASATEMSVDRTGSAALTSVFTQGFGATTIGVRTASAIEGPFSSARSAFRPPESDRGDLHVYAAKGHVALACPDTEGELIVTYAANATDFATLLDDLTVYYPRFVRLPLP